MKRGRPKSKHTHCQISGCNNPHLSRGFCKKHYYHYVEKYSPGYSEKSIASTMRWRKNNMERYKEYQRVYNKENRWKYSEYKKQYARAKRAAAKQENNK